MGASNPEPVHEPCERTAAAPEEPWEEIERLFRTWSFRVYYEKCFASELDNTLRFAKALTASCRPIRDRALVYRWYRDRKLRLRRGRTRHGAAKACA
jgi:hypothetical protein